MAMTKTVSQSFLLVSPSSSPSFSSGNRRWRRGSSTSISCTSRNRSLTCSVSVRARSTLFPCGIVKVSTESAASAEEKTIELEIGSRDGFGGEAGGGSGGGGGGGGGGRDNNDGDSNKGEDDSSDGSNDKKKMAMSMSQKLTLGYAALVGVGGVIGYAKSGSQKSLAAGGISASLLYFVYTQLPYRPAFASSLGLGLSAALLGVMGSRFKKSGKIFPAGVVSLVSLIMTGGYLHGILRSLH